MVMMMMMILSSTTPITIMVTMMMITGAIPEALRSTQSAENCLRHACNVADVRYETHAEHGSAT